MNTLLRTTITTTVLTGALAGSIALAAAAEARGGGGGVSRSAACSTGSVKLKAKADDPRVVEVEAELDVNRVGQKWTWSLTDNGALVATGKGVTAAPSGAFGVKRTITDKSGSDTLRFRAVRAGTTTACAVSVTL